MTSRSAIVLDSILELLRPAVRLMLRHGVASPAFAGALKRIFLQAAQDELRARQMPLTDSAISLLSGVHRRDVRNLTRLAVVHARPEGFSGLASQVVARWLSNDSYLDTAQTPRVIARSGEAPSFDALVRAVSQDVRPRSVLDELIRLGLSSEADGQVTLLTHAFVPRSGFPEMAAQLSNNLHDHLAAACQNLDGTGEFLEQAIFVDEITAESALHLHKVAAQAWKVAFQTVMREAQVRFDHDARHASAEQRTQRARFGVYFYATEGKENHEPPA
ncbi:MAG: hypothetical protein IPO19_00850 [Rhodoferax sp.]|nr:hypothetical protein [Rhodoferax sp.]